MSAWYLKAPARAGAGHRTTGRRLIEGAVGAEPASRLGREFTVGLATVRRMLSPAGRRSDRYLTELRDAHRGEQCVIIGNGPSLNETDMSLLMGRHTFGLNRLYMMFDKLRFSTEYHVVVNRLVVEQCAEDLAKVPGRLISSWPNRSLLAKREDAIFLHPIVGPVFSMDPRRGVWEGATVTFVALQLAYFMGFVDVILIGVDHRFVAQGKAHELVTTETHDRDHFDPNYFGRGFRWQLPDLETSEIAYGIARRAFERDGRRVVDCTLGGALTVFPKGELLRELRDA